MAIAATAMKALSAAATVYGAISTVQAGQQANANAKGIAAQQKAQANETYALRQIEAERMRKNAERQGKRQQAMLGAMGFNPQDPGGNNLTRKFVQEATLQELLTLAQGQSEYDQGNYGAQITLAKGQDAQRAGYVGGVTQLVGGGMDWFDKYGPGKKATSKKHGYSGLYGPPEVAL